MLPRLLSQREAAQLLGVSQRYLWTLRHRRGLPHVRLGRKVMYDPEALRRWIDQQSQNKPR